MKLYVGTSLAGGHLGIVELMESEKGELLCSERERPSRPRIWTAFPDGYQPTDEDRKADTAREQQLRGVNMTNNSGLARVSRHAVRALALTAVPAFLLVQSSVAQEGRAVASKVVGNDVNKTYALSDHGYASLR